MSFPPHSLSQMRKKRATKNERLVCGGIFRGSSCFPLLLLLPALPFPHYRIPIPRLLSGKTVRERIEGGCIHFGWPKIIPNTEPKRTAVCKLPATMNIAAYLCARYCIPYDRGEEKIFPPSLSYRGAIVPTPPTISCVCCVWLCSSFSQCTIFPFLSLFLCLLIRTEKSLPTTNTEEKKKKKRKTFFPNKVSRSQERLSFLSLPLNFCPISSSFSSSASAIYFFALCAISDLSLLPPEMNTG